MRPVYQNLFGERHGKNRGGNCFQAALASLLELPLSQVPDFCNDCRSDWYDRFISWLRKRGYSAIHLEVTSEQLSCPNLGFGSAESFHGCFLLISGKSPRGIPHTVIYRGGQLIHDPHPEGGGVTPAELDLIFPIDPAKRRV